MTDRPAISVVIPCRDASGTIGDQLSALARQETSFPWEVIVVDNRSSDDLEAAVSPHVDRLPELRIVPAHERDGSAHALNVGVRHARAPKVAFCDADDIVEPGWLEAMCRALDEHALVSGPLDLDALNPEWVRRTRSSPQPDGPQSKYGFLPHVASANLGARREVLEAIGGFDETLDSLHDTDLCWRAQLAGFDLHFDPRVRVQYRLRTSLRAIYRQARWYAAGDVALHRRYDGRGVAPVTWARELRGWIRLALATPLLFDRGGRARWVWIAGFRIGRLRARLRAVSWRR